MKIVLSVDAVVPPLTGIGHYVFRLAQGLQSHADVDDIRLISALRSVRDLSSLLTDGRAFTQVRRRVPFRPLARRLYHCGRAVVFRARARSLSEHLFHAPNYVMPGYSGRCVLTVHDLSHMRYPQYHPRERVRFLERELPRALAKAAQVITVSEFVRTEVIELLGIEPQRVATVPLGVDRAFRPRTESEVSRVLKHYNLSYGRYLLAVATLEPRKNLEGLIDAYCTLGTAIRKQYPLALAGADGWLAAKARRKLTRLAERGELNMLGYVPQDQLPAIYAGARAFAFPSIYEGFGLPVLEAMASGVPFLTANRSAMPEVAGDAGWLVDPLDTDALRTGLETVLLDEQWRAQCVTRGIRRAQQYSWQKCVDGTVGVYGQAQGQTAA